jgi:LDH2 family malate/lactate/ureidoglycolate dehydrogenase
MYKNMDRKQNVGHFFCLFHIEAILDYADYVKRIDAAIDEIKACKRRPGIKEILVPGERSARQAARHASEGIAVPDETRLEIQQWCSRLEVPFDLT